MHTYLGASPTHRTKWDLFLSKPAYEQVVNLCHSRKARAILLYFSPLQFSLFWTAQCHLICLLDKLYKRISFRLWLFHSCGYIAEVPHHKLMQLYMSVLFESMFSSQIWIAGCSCFSVLILSRAVSYVRPFCCCETCRLGTPLSFPLPSNIFHLIVNSQWHSQK